MSHMDDVKIKFRNLDDIRTALQALPELEWREGQRTHAWYGRFVGDSTPPEGRDPKDYGKCLHAIGRRDFNPRNGSGEAEYEIGVVAAVDGDGYELLLDRWGPGSRLVPHLNRLRQEIAAATAVRRAREQLAHKGFRVLPAERLANGRLRLRLRRG